MRSALADLAARWRHARRAALRAELPSSTGAEADDTLLAEALDANAEGACKRAFDNSLRLGVGFARTYDKELSLSELPEALELLGVPCLLGGFRKADDGEPALLLERDGCAAGALGAAACDFHREAIDGLVLGLTGGIRHARHASRGHGDPRCVDVLHVRPESPLRFGAIPDDLREGLERARRVARAFDSRAEIDVLGLSQGTLYYQIKQAGCSPELAVGATFAREVARRFPSLATREISPRSVLAGDA